MNKYGWQQRRLEIYFCLLGDAMWVSVSLGFWCFTSGAAINQPLIGLKFGCHTALYVYPYKPQIDRVYAPR